MSNSLRRPSSRKNKRIVKTGDEKDVVHLEGHQILEAFKALFGVQNGLGDAATHGDILAQICPK